MRRLGKGCRKPLCAQEPAARPPQMPIPPSALSPTTPAADWATSSQGAQTPVRMGQGSLAPGAHGRHSTLQALADQVRPGKCWKYSFLRQDKQKGLVGAEGPLGEWDPHW